MLVRISIIIDFLKEWDPVFEPASGEAPVPGFGDVRIAYDGQCEFDRDVLYILRGGPFTPPCEGITFISADPEQPRLSNDHLLRVSFPHTTEQLCSLVSGCVRSISGWSERLSLAILEGCDAQTLLDHSVHYLNNPCVILDGIFNCVAISDQATEKDELYWDIKLHGKPSAQTMLILSENNKTRKSYYGRFASGLGYRISTGPTSYPEIYVDIKTDESLVLAFNLRFSHTAESPGLIDIIGIFVESLQRLYELRARTDPNTGLITFNEYLFPRILNGEPEAIRLAKTFKPFQHHYAIVTSTAEDVRALARSILEVMPDSYLFSYERNYYIFIPVDLFQENSIHFIGRQEEQLQRIGEAFSTQIGMSGPVWGSEYLATACRQAISAIQLHSKGLWTGPGSGNLLMYRDIAFADMVSQYRQENPLCSFAPLSYITMSSYDKEHGTDYCAFVKTFIANGCSSAKTAQQLFLHKNSVIYRLEKIKECFHLDIADVSGQLLFLLAFLSDNSACPDSLPDGQLNL